MEWLKDLFENPFLCQVFWSVVMTRVIRLFLDPEMLPEARRFAPSARSAAMASVALTAGLDYGWHSFEFAIALLVAVAVCSNAAHLRKLGSQVAQLNRQVRELKGPDMICDLPRSEPAKDAGCSPIQIMLGIAVGVIVTLVRLVFGFAFF